MVLLINMKKNWGCGKLINKRFFLVMIVFLLSLGLFGCQTNTEENQIKQTIQGYYTKSYDMWINLKVEDLSNYLDLESIQSYNKVIALEENVEKWRYAIEKDYFQGQREKHDLSFKFNSIDINNNEAIVEVAIIGESSGTPAYPFFVHLGKNTFKLKEVDDNWLIYEHDYESNYFYEKSKTEKMHLDIEKIHQEVERDHK